MATGLGCGGDAAALMNNGAVTRSFAYWAML
jgi:hypothetical protein